MKPVSTDKLLTLGMALYADRRTMEQRVRGIFGRKRSTGLARAMAVALCLVVGVTCFTTACMPVREEAATGGNAATSGNAASAAAVPEPAASEAAASKRAAAENAAALIEKVFGETVDAADMRVDVDASNWYTVFAHWAGVNDFAYSAHVDKRTGEVTGVSRNVRGFTLDSQQLAIAETHDAPDSIYDVTAMDWACSPVARALVEESFLDGREIVETVLSFTMSDNEMEPQVQVGVKVHVDEGACYTVTVRWPQLVVESFSVYSLGWDACVHGYYNPFDAVGYTPVGERWLHMAGDPVTFDGISYYYLPLEEGLYFMQPAYRYDYDEAYMDALPDKQLSEADAWEKAQQALTEFYADYRNAPERFTLDECVSGEGAGGNYPTWRFRISDRTAKGIRRGWATLYIDRYGNVAHVEISARSAYDDRDVDVELKFTEQELIALALAHLESQGYDGNAASYTASVETHETTWLGAASVEWTVTLTEKKPDPDVFEVAGNGRTGEIRYFWNTAERRGR